MPDRDSSATPLWKKLGLKPGKTLAVTAAASVPAADIKPLLDEFPPTHNRTDADVHLLFATSRARLASDLGKLAATLPADGGLWVAWPKKSSAVENDLAFEHVQSIGLEAGLVDNKSCSIDRDWQALRFVYRLKDRAGRGR